MISLDCGFLSAVAVLKGDLPVSSALFLSLSPSLIRSSPKNQVQVTASIFGLCLFDDQCLTVCSASCQSLKTSILSFSTSPWPGSKEADKLTNGPRAHGFALSAANTSRLKQFISGKQSLRKGLGL